MITLRNSFTLVFIFFTVSVFAQTKEAKEKFKKEKDQIFTLIEEGLDYKQALKRAEDGMQWAKQAELDSMYWSFYCLKATTHKVMYESDTALALFKTLDSVAAAKRYTKMQVGVELSIIRILRDVDDVNNDRPKWIAKLKPLVESINEVGYLADWEGEMASWKRREYDYEGAMKHYLKQISYLEDSVHDIRRAFSVQNLGGLLFDMKKYSQSIKYYKNAIALFLKHNADYYTPLTYSNIGYSFFCLEMSDSAKVYYLKGLEIAKKYNDDMALVTCYVGVAEMAIDQKDYSATLARETETMLHEALAISEKLELTERQANVNLFLGESAFRTKNYPVAEQFLTKSLRLAKLVNSKVVMSNALLYLGKLYTETLQYPKAIAAINQAMLYKDSIYEDNIINNTSELEARYQSERKEAEISKLNDEQKILHLAHLKEQILGASIFAIMVMIGVIGWVIYYYRNKRRMEQKEKELQQLHYRVAETRQIAMRAQMNPHFIFNCMAAADHYILNNERNIASELLTSFADLVRRVLEYSEFEMIPLHEEFKSLELFLKVERLRFHNKFTYVIDLDETLEFDVPPLLLQPYVENAILHGISHLTNEGKIEISAKSDSEGIVNIIIRDNGVGMKQSSSFKKENRPMHQSMGTRITKERMALLRLLHNIKINVTVNDLSEDNSMLHGTEISISLEKYSVLMNKDEPVFE